MKSLEGKALDMNSFQGMTVFINVWATWCRLCIQEMPTIAEAMKKLGDRNVVFLFASSEDISEIAEFKDRKSFPFTYVQLGNLEALSVKAIPATFIFSPEGDLSFGEEGFRDWSKEENLKLILPNL
jgi:thiol-disulfide isomerase/thioredoxin